MPRALLFRLSPCWLLALTMLGAAVPSSPGAAEDCGPSSRIAATDLLQVRQLLSPALSPDGRWVAYVVRSIEPKPDAKDDWTYRSQLWLAATDGSAQPRQLTQTGNNTSPIWSPDGTRLAFVRTIGKEKPQIHLLPLAGGEAVALTKLATGATNPQWSPDGGTILFSSTLNYAQVRAALVKSGAAAKPAWEPERPGRTANDTANWGLKPKQDSAAEGDHAEKMPAADPNGDLTLRREWLAGNETDGNPRVLTRLEFFGESDLQPDLEFQQLYLVKVEEGAAPRLLTRGFASYGDARWLRDGTSVVCVGPRTPEEHPDRDLLGSLCVIDVASGTARVLLARAGENYAEPRPSPDGKWIAFTVRPGGPLSFDPALVAVIATEGGEPRILTAGLDRTATHLAWSSDSDAIYFVAANEGAFPLYRTTLASGETTRLTTDPNQGVQDFSTGSGALAQTLTNPANPCELHLSDTAGHGSHALTAHNADWLAGKKLSAYEPHSFVNKEGLKIDYWLLKPAEFDPAKKYPLLVQIHGGPSAMWGPGEQTMWHEFQYYAARGYVIVFANPRGSGGYGRAFQRANFMDWGTGPAGDVLQAAEFAAREPYVDRSRQVLTGGSYGGYLTAWIVGHDRRFKAAIAQRGVYDLRTFFGEGNAWFLLPLYFGGHPWEEKVRPILERESPLTYVANIVTPLLIQHGDADLRTGFVQSQMLYKSLKVLGRPVEYVRYPRATHEMSRNGEPKQRLDSLVRYEEFFRRFIGEN